MATDRTIETCLVYVDLQDPTAQGWAWRVTYTDGHQESGPADDLDDGISQCAACAPEGVVPLEVKHWQYREYESGSYLFAAE